MLLILTLRKCIGTITKLEDSIVHTTRSLISIFRKVSQIPSIGSCGQEVSKMREINFHLVLLIIIILQVLIILQTAMTFGVQDERCYGEMQMEGYGMICVWLGSLSMSPRILTMSPITGKLIPTLMFQIPMVSTSVGNDRWTQSLWEAPQLRNATMQLRNATSSEFKDLIN